MMPAQPNQSLIDGIRCLQAVATASEPMGSRELARLLEMEPTRANRLLKTLAAQGFLFQDAQRKYRSGAGMHVLAAQSLHGSGILQRALPVMARLRQERPELMVALGVLWRDQVSYLYHATPGMPEHLAIGRLGLYPATMSSIGLALLASCGDAEVRALYHGKEVPGHPGGLPSLLKTLKDARRQGYVQFIAPGTPNHSTLAVPVGSPPEVALAFAGDTLFPDTAAVSTRLRQAAEEISNPMKGRHP